MLLVYLYLIAGIIYAFYVHLNGTERWYWFGVNVIFGPFMALFIFYKTWKGERIKYPD